MVLEILDDNGVIYSGYGDEEMWCFWNKIVAGEDHLDDRKGDIKIVEVLGVDK